MATRLQLTEIGSSTENVAGNSIGKLRWPFIWRCYGTVMMHASRFISALLFLLSAILLSISILAPFAEHHRWAWSQYLYQITRTFCHQMPTRCIWIFHSNMAVCSHCFGLLSGVCAGSAYGLWGRSAYLDFSIREHRTRFYILFAIATAVFLAEVFIQSQHLFKVHPHVLRVVVAFGFSSAATVWLTQIVLKKKKSVHMGGST